jgi:glutamyl-tRNA synthetase
MLRFAPSPTGDMHIGNLRVALFNHIVAKQRNEQLMIRIEDTDQERNIEGKDQEILEILAKFGVEYSNVSYQSKNFRFHHQFAVELLRTKKAFNCFCKPEDLDKKREEANKNKKAYRYDGACENLPDENVIDREDPFVVRIKKPKETITVDDKIKGTAKFSPDDIDSFIILRQDKTPTYNFASSIDDMLGDISLVIRGEDHFSNTAKQITIRQALNYDKNIEYAHLPIILNEDGKKMSKRDSASSLKWLLEQGFIPDAIINYLILLGNKTPDKSEIFTLNEALEFFDLKNISKAPAKFDMTKLRFLNREHLKKLDNLELAKSIGYFDEEIGKLAKIYLEEASTTVELKEKIDLILNRPADFSVPDEYAESIEKLKIAIKNNSEEFEEFNKFKKHLMKETELKGKQFFKSLRIVLTGAESGPEISEIYTHLKFYLLKIVK